MEGRRRFARWLVNKPVKAKFDDSKSYMNCHLEDIGYMGARLLLPQEITSGDNISLTIALAKDYTIEAEAAVPWQKDKEYGFYFLRIKDICKEKIYSFVSRYVPEQINNLIWKGTSFKEGGTNMSDRRLFQRFLVKLPLKYLAQDNEKENSGNTHDISAQGIGLVVEEEIRPETPLDMRLEIPDKGAPLEIRGKVSWVSKTEAGKFRVGVNLDRPNPMGFSRILRIAERLKAS